MITLTRSNASPAQAAELKVSALSSDTASYLSTRAGTIIEAKVVRVVTQLAGNNPNASASVSVGPTAGSSTTSKANSETYRVELLSEGKALVVESSRAPRRGELLRLEVLDAQNLRILLDAGKRTASQPTSSQPINSPTVNQPPSGTTAAGTRTTSGDADNPILKIQSALRDSLPKQAEIVSVVKRNELLQLLTSLLQNNPATNPSATDKPVPQTTNSYSQLVRNLANTLQNAKSGVAQASSPQPGTDSRSVLPQGNLTPNLASEKPASASANTPGTTTAATTVTTTTRTTTKPTTGTTTSTTANTPAPALLYTQATANPATQQSITNSLRELFAILQVQNAQQLNPASLATPYGVQNAILNSGHFYEAKLLGAVLSGLPSETAASSDRAVTGSPERRERISEIVRNISASLQPGSNRAPELANDSKYQQLQLSKALAALINKLQASVNNQQQKLEAARDTQVNALWDVVQTTVQSTSNDTSAEKGLADALLQILKLTLAQTARTQSQQLLSLSSQLASQLATGEGSTTQSLNYTIPLWINNQFKPLDLLIERDEETHKPDRRDRSPAWNVRLRFDLDELGELVALASLREKTVNAVFWAEKQALVKKVEAGFSTLTSTLTAAGISVNRIFCRVGKPELTDSYSITQQLADSLLNTQI